MEKAISTLPPFAGYGQPTFTQIPDYFLDHQMHTLTGAAVKVMLYIFRHTYGYRKTCDAISYQQFVTGIVRADGQIVDQGAGISTRGLAAALDELEEKSLIFRHMEFTPSGSKGTTIYEVNLDGEPHYKPKILVETRPGDALPAGKRVQSKPQRLDYPTAKIAVPPTAEIAVPPTAKIADTTNNGINKQHINKHHGAGLSAAGGDDIVIDLLIKAGISQDAANELAVFVSQKGRDRGYVAQIVDYALGQSRIINKAGYVTRLIRNNAPLPEWHQTAQEGHSGPKLPKNPIDFSKYQDGGKYGFIGRPSPDNSEDC